ncbi:MAG TPA: hypothetical protein VFQ49_05525 [Actinomycetes bacterium]|nr:hypothetical protein [Actinomycetes bacterium]
MKARPQTTVAPLGPDRQRWRRQLAWLARAVGGERDPGGGRRLNATRWHRGLSRLLALGLDDAHERRGRGWAATWRRDRRPLPPLLRAAGPGGADRRSYPGDVRHRPAADRHRPP